MGLVAVGLDCMFVVQGGRRSSWQSLRALWFGQCLCTEGIVFLHFIKTFGPLLFLSAAEMGTNMV